MDYMSRGHPAMSFLKVAMPKGRIYKVASKLFREAGVPIPSDFDDTRKLIIELPEAGHGVYYGEARDVPTYVEYGVADIGIVGKDVLMEENKDVMSCLIWALRNAGCRSSVCRTGSQSFIRVSRRNIRM